MSMVMGEETSKRRTKQFGLRVMNLVDALPETKSGSAIGNQLIVLRAVGDRRRSLFQSLVSLKKKRMKACIGWNRSLKATC